MHTRRICSSPSPDCTAATAAPGRPAPGHGAQGYTLIELLIVLGILGIVAAFSALSVRGLHNDADSSVSLLTGALTQARTTALSTTSAVRVTLKSTGMAFETSPGCLLTTGWTTVPTLDTELPVGVKVTATTPSGADWAICFTSRGELQDAAPANLTVKDLAGHVRTMIVYLTGAVG